MCYQSHELTSSGLTLKDFIPFITTLFTVGAGYLFLSIQARKNRKLQLVENLRKEIASFYSLILQNSIIKQLEGVELISSIAAIQLLLDDKDPDQKSLIEKMTEINNNMAESILYRPDYEGLMKLAKKIIENQIRKAEKLF